jgi:hypothetical protein
VEAIQISARLASLGIQVLQPGSHIRRRAVTAARPARTRAANRGVDFTITPTLSCAARRFFRPCALIQSIWQVPSTAARLFKQMAILC